MSAPRASVVVPTRDRPERLRALLHSLAEQDPSARPFEVILVDDASDMAPPEVPDEGVLAEGITLRVLRHPSTRGPAAARNTGWGAATGALVAFIDDDCRAAPGWLARLLSAWEGDAASFVQGRTEPDPAERSRLRPLSRTQDVRAPGFFETCNIAYPRDLLERIGGFDERFRRACGEDVDIGVRAIKAGARLVFAPEALAYHAVDEPSLAAICRHTFRYTDAVRLLGIHPDLRDRLPWRFFWKRTHPPLLAALGGLAWAIRTRNSRFSLLAALPYLEHYHRRYSSDGRTWAMLVRWLPAHLVVDLCELATMVAGSVRHRTLMF